jgi:MarR family
MQLGGRRERIIEAIRISSRPLDDYQLADRTGISPRQSVNQICRELERAGMVRRRPGPDGKIVNEWLGNRDQQPGSVQRTPGAGVSQAIVTEAAAIQAGHELPPGSSREQRDAERVMLDLLSQQIGRELNPATLTVPSGERVEVDGADADRSVLIECWAHQGPPKSAQRHKVLADAFKLT